MDESSSWLTIYSGVGIVDGLIRLACQIALLVIVYGVVRRHRPDAWTSLRAWAIGGVVAAVVTPIAWRIVPRLGTASDPMAWARVGTFLMVFDSLVTVGLVLLLVKGLVRIAQPPPPIVIGETPPYR
jgi:multisubunit Na+/H+ antiporter MnhB subunit